MKWLYAAMLGIAVAGPSAQAAPNDIFDVLEIVFSDAEERMIREYYGDRRGDIDRSRLPPGLAKKDKLPPGIAKKLRRDGSLPPGLAKRQLPEELIVRLPKRRGGYEPVIVDRDIVLIEVLTGRVLDVIADVIGQSR